MSRTIAELEAEIARTRELFWRTKDYDAAGVLRRSVKAMEHELEALTTRQPDSRRLSAAVE